MNPHTRKNILAKLLLSLIEQKNKGYSLVEVISLLVIAGILIAVVAPVFDLNNTTVSSYAQLKGILQQTRGRAISTTSAIRIKPDPSQPDNKFILERSNSRGCEAVTKLSDDAEIGDTDLEVYSTEGFQIGDLISVGTDSTDNEILSIPTGGSSIISLGVPINTDQSVDSVVELANNWQADNSLSEKDLTLPEDAQVSANITDWTVCISSRGIAFIYDSTLSQQNSLVLTISNTTNSDTETLTILKGGAIQ